MLEDAEHALVTNASALVTSAAAACTDGPALRRGADGTIASLLALDDKELAADATRTDGKHRWLTPTGGFVHEGRGYLYYAHEEGAGFLDSRSVGTGLCVIDPGATTCRRVEVGGSTVLWTDEQRTLDQGGLVIGDRAVVYSCRSLAELSRICTASGAPLDRIEDPTAYQYLSIFNGWVDDPLLASVLTTDLGPITVSHYQGTILPTILDPFGGSVYVRPTKSAYEPFDHAVHAFTIVPTEGLFPGGGREHAALRTMPREIDVSYTVEEAGATKLHLATFQFNEGRLGEGPQPGVVPQ